MYYLEGLPANPQLLPSEESMSAGIEIFDRLSEGSEGGTVALNGLPLPTRGFYVGGSVPPLVIREVEYTPDLAWTIELFVQSAPTVFIGYWIDSETGFAYVDAVDWFPGEFQAGRVGRQRREIAIWDIHNERELRLTYAEGE